LTKADIAALKHDPEKWKPFFRKDPAQTGKLKRDGDSTKDHRASERDEFRSAARFRPQLSSWGASPSLFEQRRRLF
jgi:hypothetical protein